MIFFYGSLFGLDDESLETLLSLIIARVSLGGGKMIPFLLLMLFELKHTMDCEARTWDERSIELKLFSPSWFLPVDADDHLSKGERQQQMQAIRALESFVDELESSGVVTRLLVELRWGIENVVVLDDELFIKYFSRSCMTLNIRK